MNGKPKTEAIRLLFELERADNPRLYDELASFRQGVKRVNRLRTLAHEGLLSQYLRPGWGEQPSEGQGGAASADDMTPLDKEAATIMNQVLDSPIME